MSLKFMFWTSTWIRLSELFPVDGDPSKGLGAVLLTVQAAKKRSAGRTTHLGLGPVRRAARARGVPSGNLGNVITLQRYGVRPVRAIPWKGGTSDI